ncbi:MAG: hypothetical protein EOP00_35475 [Pedobacter sp.]|nr:MAG: hypothetical protein EOP00_35475 [Pedobacter sp.]
MKFFITLLLICVYISKTEAQEVKNQSIKGSWEYKSPKGKSKLVYKFDLDNKFTSTTERNEKEELITGSYEIDKKGEIDRLILSQTNKENGTQTHILYHLIKFVGPDTLKVQAVNEKQSTWLTERRKNTMTFIRKVEKPKAEKQ